jgi:hypothetical protein
MCNSCDFRFVDLEPRQWRYQATAAQWERLAPLLPGKAGDPAWTPADNQLFVNVSCGSFAR